MRRNSSHTSPGTVVGYRSASGHNDRNRGVWNRDIASATSLWTPDMCFNDIDIWLLAAVK